MTVRSARHLRAAVVTVRRFRRLRAAVVTVRRSGHVGASSSRRRRGERGQAAVELVAALPLVAVLTFAVWQTLAAGAAEEAAGSAAQAAAMALLQDGDPEQAARDALRSWPAAATSFRRSGSRVHITVRPRGPLPALANVLTASATADAGAQAAAPAPEPVRGGDGFSAVVRRQPPRSGERGAHWPGPEVPAETGGAGRPGSDAPPGGSVERTGSDAPPGESVERTGSDAPPGGGDAGALRR